MASQSSGPGWRRHEWVDLFRQWPWVYPRGIESSARAWIQRSQSRGGWYEGLRGNWREVLHPDGVVVSPLPPDLPEAARPAFNEVATRRHPEASVSFISGAHLVSDEGLVLTPDNRVLAEFYHLFGTRPLARSLLDRPFGLTRKRVQRTGEAIALLAAPQGRNYYHWLFDVLPRVALLERWRTVIGRYAVPSGLSAVQLESLRLLGVDANRLFVLEPRERWRCQHLYIPSLPGSEGCYPPWSLQFLRDKFLHAAAGVKGAGDRIYIRRGQPASRPVLNEDELIAALVRRGFAIVAPEEHTLIEQVARFRDARVIVAAHGAGLANLVFATPGTAVIELFSADYLRPDCYFTLARRGGLAYDCWLDPASPGSRQPWGAIAAEVPAIERKLDALERKHATD